MLPAEFPYKLTIADDLRKKMGKKKKRKNVNKKYSNDQLFARKKLTQSVLLI